MFETIGGLPLHALVIHAVVVFLPLASIAVLAAAVWPRFRRWAGPLPLILAVGATALIPVATESGEYLKQFVGGDQNAAVNRHQSLGDLMLYWGLGLVVAAGLLYYLQWQSKRAAADRRPPAALVIASIAIAAVASIGTLVHVYRVGDSGAHAVWDGTIPEQSSP